MIVAATGACAASVQKLAGLGVRWQSADAASPKFGRFAWLDRGRGTLTLGGTPAECRDSGGGNLPVDHDCDADSATPPALRAPARPRTQRSGGRGHSGRALRASVRRRHT